MAMNERPDMTGYLRCPIRQVISRFGDKWSLLVLYTLHVAPGSAPLRFSELRKSMADCSTKMLAQTLRRLERNRLVSRRVFPEMPPRVEYALTELGRSLMPSVNALIEWADRHFGEFADGTDS